MPIFILLGWIIGLLLGALSVVFGLLALGFAVPAALGALAAILGPLIGLLAPVVALVITLLFAIICFLTAYLIATASIAPLLPGATGLAAVTFPLVSKLPVPGAVPVSIPATRGEFLARGILIGLSAAINTILLSLVPLAGPVLASWAFTIISLSAIIFVARNRVYQGFLGWSGWLFPLSYLATAIGLLLFIVNIPFAFIAFGITAFDIDWTTGVIESRGGLAGITGFNGGFSLGNFIFLAGTATTVVAGRFTASTISSHETGHSLNTAAMGGVVLWINAIDENILPRRINLAYGELNAESHSRNMPGPSRLDYSVRLWF